MAAAAAAAAAEAGGGRRVEEEQVRRAVEAVMRWEGARKGRQRAQLLESEQLIYLVVALRKYPQKARTNPYRIRIPHPLFSLDGSHDLCLFLDDRKLGSLARDEAKRKLAEQHIRISKLIALSKLRSDYVPFEAKRKLCGSYDLFLADKALLPRLPRLIGKAFFRKKKHPIPLDLTRADWRRQIEAACASAFFYIWRGTCSVLRVGRLSQTKDQIAENVSAAILGVASVVPKKWDNIKAIYLKSSESVALPLYQALPEVPFRVDVSHVQLKKDDEQQAPGDVPELNAPSMEKDSTDVDAQEDRENSDMVDQKARRKNRTPGTRQGKVGQTAEPVLHDVSVEMENSAGKDELGKDGMGKRVKHAVNVENRRGQKRETRGLHLEKLDEMVEQEPCGDDAVCPRKRASEIDFAKMDSARMPETPDITTESKDAKMITASSSCHKNSSMDCPSVDSKESKHAVWKIKKPVCTSQIQGKNTAVINHGGAFNARA